jgi:simple sugar transport system permease protein
MDATLLLLAATLRIAVPYVLAALGGWASERGGVVQIGLEGLLLVGAFTCVAVAHAAEVAGLSGAQAAAYGIVAAAVAGAAFAAIHALVCIRFGADAIVSGIALNLLAAGATKFLLTLVFGSAANSSRIVGTEGFGVLATPLVLVMVLALVACDLASRRTPFGIRLHAVGEHPDAAAAAGIRVGRVRTAGVLLSGVLAALGGAHLALDQHQFTAGMASGRGFIAVAALVFGRWTPRGAAAACILFAAAEALQIHLQAHAARAIPTQLVQMLPYVVTLAALVGAVHRARPPAALGRSPG